MSKDGYDFWGHINTYEEVIKVGRTYIGVIFDLYVSKEGQLGWSRYDPEKYHEPPRPLKGIKANSDSLSFGISWMLSFIAKNELKKPVPDSLDMLLENVGVIAKISDDIQAYNILESTGIR
ncbi:MAG: hypothetical protein V1831_03950 [Candidatus Woesearchaeota archaeon]